MLVTERTALRAQLVSLRRAHARWIRANWESPLHWTWSDEWAYHQLAVKQLFEAENRRGRW